MMIDGVERAQWIKMAAILADIQIKSGSDAMDLMVKVMDEGVVDEFLVEYNAIKGA